MTKQEATEYIQHRLSAYVGRGDEINYNHIKEQEFTNKVNMVINELLCHHHFIIVSDFNRNFRLAGMVATENGIERCYEQFR